MLGLRKGGKQLTVIVTLSQAQFSQTDFAKA